MLNVDAIFVATPDISFVNALESSNKNVVLVDLWRYLDGALASQFKRYIGYGVCQDDDNCSENLEDIWRDYE